MTPSQFAAFFGPPSIRAELDWDRAATSSVALRVLDLAELRSVGHLVWYLGPHGSEASYHDSDAHPVALDEIDRVWDRLDPARRRRIGRLADELESQPAPLQFVIPTYGLDHGRELVLDGNHRTAACVARGLDARVLVASLRGPIDPGMLPDLVHWVG